MLPILNLEDLGFLVKVIFFQIHVYGRIYIFKMDYKEIKNDYLFCYTMFDCLIYFFQSFDIIILYVFQVTMQQLKSILTSKFSAYETLQKKE